MRGKEERQGGMSAARRSLPAHGSSTGEQSGGRGHLLRKSRAWMGMCPRGEAGHGWSGIPADEQGTAGDVSPQRSRVWMRTCPFGGGGHGGGQPPQPPLLTPLPTEGADGFPLPPASCPPTPDLGLCRRWLQLANLLQPQTWLGPKPWSMAPCRHGTSVSICPSP